MRSLKMAGIAVLMTAGLVLATGTKITPPKNQYKPQDDVQLGREAAAQVKRELPLLPQGGTVDAYVERVGRTLTDAIPPEFQHSEFRYDFDVVNASDINAFALPGGPMFVNRGMIEAAHSEGEMAGVMAHEISHVALRHGTAQATKAQNPGIQLGALGGAILGAVIGGNAGDIVAQGTQLGLSTYLLKFSREYETQADLLGAQIMARAGYDPRDLARMFQTIEREGGAGGPEWLSSHPSPEHRYERISEEAAKLNVASNPRTNQTEFERTKSALNRMAPAPSSADLAKAGETTTRGDSRIDQNVEPPSRTYRHFDLPGSFSVSVPENWDTYPGDSSVTFAPRGAAGNSRGEFVFTHGAIVGFAQMPDGDLAQASNRYIEGIQQSNGYLDVNGGYARRRIDGRAALRRRLSGTSPLTGEKEAVEIYTAWDNPGRLFYFVQVVPDREKRTYSQAFNAMLNSVDLDN